MRPMLFTRPFAIGPLLTKTPSVMVRTLAVVSMGAPLTSSDSTLPPRRTLMVAPTPALTASSTTSGSVITARAAFFAPISTSFERMWVPSPGPPPPGLSDGSARTTGPAGAFIPLLTASSRGVRVLANSSFFARISDASASTMSCARAGSPSVTARTDIPV